MEQQQPDFPVEERWQQAAGNANALFFAIIAYLREQGLSPAEFISWLGQHFAPGWEGVRGNMEQIGHYAALNPVALGAELRNYKADENEVSFEIRGWPSEPYKSQYEQEADIFLQDLYRPIMEYLDIDYEGEREGDAVIFHLRRRRAEENSGGGDSSAG